MTWVGLAEYFTWVLPLENKGEFQVKKERLLTDLKGEFNFNV